ncbi:MAG: sulfotransferase, partial [Saprospiraceae bacterium]|nr:sulfotransferase [Saprospiraceae bacterium]
MKAPFFIVGVPRSGTTLLSVLLSNHPQVYIDGESVGISIAENMEKYKRLFAYRPGRGQRAVLTQVIRDSYKQRLEKLLDYEQLDQYADLRDFFHRSVNRRAEEHGKLLWGDKTPELIFDLPQLLQVFPDARFLHVVRDARSNAQ